MWPRFSVHPSRTQHLRLLTISYDDSMAFCRRLLNEAGVATTPGLDFDPQRGARTLRLSYAGPEAEVAEGVARLGAFLAGQPKR